MSNDAVKGPKDVMLQGVQPDVLKRNLSHVLEVLDKNRYENSTNAAKLIAVTKTVDADTVNALKPLHILDIAENRAQVALPKLEKIDKDFQMHWIGRLQTNKVKYIIDKVCMLHTLDRLALAQEVDRQAALHQRILPCLVQVNVAREPQKAGLDVTEVRDFLHQMKDFHSISVCGLMTMMPLTDDVQLLTGLFRQTRALFDRLANEAIDGVRMDELSMGMSNDYAIAAREGATMVRVGTALYRP